MNELRSIRNGNADESSSAAARVDTRRRNLLVGMTLAALGAPRMALGAGTPAEVWKGPACGCCKDWVRYLESNGFSVTVHDDGNTDARQRLGMPARLGGCHTARIGDYTIEGHVPVREIRRLLKERPDAVGLAVPAMPRGAPGMDGPDYGGQRDAFDVLLVRRDGSARVYQTYA